MIVLSETSPCICGRCNEHQTHSTLKQRLVIPLGQDFNRAFGGTEEATDGLSENAKGSLPEEDASLPLEKTVPVWVKENGGLESTLSRWRKEVWLNPDYSDESASQIAEKTAQDNAATTDNGPLVGNPVVSCSPTDRPRQ